MKRKEIRFQFAMKKQFDQLKEIKKTQSNLIVVKN